MWLNLKPTQWCTKFILKLKIVTFAMKDFHWWRKIADIFRQTWWSSHFSYSMPIKIVVWEHRPPNARMTNSVFINRHRLGLKRKQNDRTWSSVLIFEAYEVFRWPQAPLVAFACGICRIIYLCVSVRLEAYRNIWPYIYGKQGNVILRQLKFRLQGCLQQGGFTSRQRWK